MIFLLLVVVVVVDDDAVTAIDPDPLLHIIMIIINIITIIRDIICFIIVMTDYRNTKGSFVRCGAGCGWDGTTFQMQQIKSIPQSHTGDTSNVCCCLPHNQEDTGIPYFVPRGWTDGPTEKNHCNSVSIDPERMDLRKMSLR